MIVGRTLVSLLARILEGILIKNKKIKNVYFMLSQYDFMGRHSRSSYIRYNTSVTTNKLKTIMGEDERA